jgi:hypothetical protein
MYSILIADEKKWKYYTNPNGTKYVAETLEAVQEKVKEISRTTPLDNIVVVKNCTITSTITVVEDGTEETQG